MGGKDKAEIMLAGKTLLDRVACRIAPQAEAVVVNRNEGRLPTELPIISDSIAGFAGPLAGILAGLDWAGGQGFEWLVSVPVDTPFIPADLVERLEAAARGNDIACAASGGRIHPVIALVPVRLAADLRQALLVEALRKVDLWTARYRAGIAEWPAAPYDPFFNINRPQDLREAERIAASHCL
jgi:molybdopterin-guanine dinucleotide biosynthesis protein A